MCDAIFITYRLSRAGDNGVRCTHQPRGSEILLRQGAILASNCAFSAAGRSSSRSRTMVVASRPNIFRIWRGVLHGRHWEDGLPGMQRCVRGRSGSPLRA